MENIKFYKINEPFGEFSNFSPMEFLMTLVYIGRQVSIIFKLKNLSLKSLVKKLDYFPTQWMQLLRDEIE